MSTHPLRDLAWEVDRLLDMPASRDRFISRCRQHLEDLRDRKPRGSLAYFYVPPTNSLLNSYPGTTSDTRLGWLTAYDDENVTLQEEYAILAALRELVYKGRDRLFPWRIDNTLLTDLYISGGLSEIWASMIAAVKDRLTEEHRSYVESWLRDVRLDLSRPIGNEAGSKTSKPSGEVETPPTAEAPDEPPKVNEPADTTESMEAEEANDAVMRNMPTVNLNDSFLESVSGSTQRKLLKALNGKRNVPIADVLSAVYGTADRHKLEALLKAKDRLNCVLAEKNAGCELRKEGDTLTLSPI